jgi:hypothetical protein
VSEQAPEPQSESKVASEPEPAAGAPPAGTQEASSPADGTSADGRRGARPRPWLQALRQAPAAALRGVLAFARSGEAGPADGAAVANLPRSLDRLPGLRWWSLAGLLFGVVVAYGGALATPFHGEDLEVLLRAAGVDPGEPLPALERLAPEPRPAAEELARAPQGPSAAEPLPPLWRLAPIDVINIVGDDVQGDVGSLLSGYSLALSLRLWGAESHSYFDWPTPLFYRLENLLWLGAAAIAMWTFARRVALPWIGGEQAWAAATAASLMFVVHPLCVPSVVSLSGRSDLMALTFAMFCAAAFLRGRQERMPPFVLLAGVLCVAAGLSGQLALVLPFGLAISELASARRFRAHRRRLNTAINSLLIFSVGVQLNVLAVSTLTGHGYYPRVGYGLAQLFDPGVLGAAIVGALRKLGLVLLPANTSSLGFAGVLLAGALLLLALQPVMAAVRNAPRLWGWVGVWFGVALFGAFLFSIQEPASLEGLAAARSLLPAATVVCAGLGLCATALSGARRALVPWVLGAGYAVLALGNAQPWAQSGYELEQLTAELAEARAEYPAPRPLLVLDAPRDVRGLDPLGSILPWLLHPLFGRAGSNGPEPFADAEQAAVLQVLRGDLPTPWPPDTLVGLRADADGETAPARRWRLAGGAPGEGGAERVVNGPRWNVDESLDPRRFGGVRARLVDAPRKSRVSWTLDWEGATASGSTPLSRLPAEDGEAFLVADLENDLRWRLAVDVTALELRADDAETSERVSELRVAPSLDPGGSEALAPARVEGRWSFPRPESGLWELAKGGSWVASFLEVESLQRREFRLSRSREALRSRPMERWLNALEPGERVAWELDYRVQGLACVRFRGHLVVPPAETD